MLNSILFIASNCILPILVVSIVLADTGGYFAAFTDTLLLIISSSLI